MKCHHPLLIERPLELRGWRELALDEAIPLEHHDLCPCCNQGVGSFVALIGNSGKQRISIGRCERCGWVGFCDRPSEAWFERFYLSDWDAANKNRLARNRPRNTDETGAKKQKPSRNTHTLLSIVTSLNLDRKNARILEIGCGYGGALAALKNIGFRNLFGVENSAHRARIASEETGGNVLTGDFTTLARQGALRAASPFDLIFSSHVLEHIAAPRALLAAARMLQHADGSLIVSMPNQKREPAAAIIFFLPHLHSYTLTSLSTLLGETRYEVVDPSATTDAELYVLARATEHVAEPLHQLATSRESALEKFTRELALRETASSAAYRRLWWDRKDNTKSGQLSCHQPPLFEKLHYALQKLLRPELRNARSILVRNANTRLTDAPIEFQFEGPVRLFYK